MYARQSNVVVKKREVLCFHCVVGWNLTYFVGSVTYVSSLEAPPFLIPWEDYCSICYHHGAILQLAFTQPFTTVTFVL